MQKTTLSPNDWIRILERVADDVEAQKGGLSFIDEGLAKGVAGARGALGTLEPTTIDRVFLTAAQAFASASSSPAAALIAAILTNTGKSFAGRTTFGAEEGVWMLETMEKAAIEANVGGSLVRALEAAVGAAQEANGETLEEVLRLAVNAALAIAQSGPGPDRDAGATALAVVLRSAYEAVANG